ncbi:hypothetical protein [Pseudomonas sp. NPDC089569]|uniref:hypothetical protein n=1 Tax=Pseudomonas sp. NPDC089569 TaxID=3390722 RepID=UPI003CFD29EE
MAPRNNHRNAFGNDPRFLERLAKQGITLGGEPEVSATATEKAPLKAPSNSTKRLQKVQEANKESRLDSLVYNPETNSLSALFPVAMLLSLNIMLRLHDAQGTGLKRTWQKRIEALMYEHKATFDQWRAAATFPLVIEEIYITAESSLLDQEAVSAGCKPIIDAFVKNGFLPDDSPEYVAHPIPYTERGPSAGLLIRFRPSPRPWGLIQDETISHARTMVS